MGGFARIAIRYYHPKCGETERGCVRSTSRSISAWAFVLGSFHRLRKFHVLRLVLPSAFAARQSAATARRRRTQPRSVGASRRARPTRASAVSSIHRLSAAHSRSVFNRNWPHAASMSWPFSRRNVAVTFCFSNAARKASCAGTAGRVQGKPSTVL
jgi:hypothetical protein